MCVCVCVRVSHGRRDRKTWQLLFWRIEQFISIRVSPLVRISCPCGGGGAVNQNPRPSGACPGYGVKHPRRGLVTRGKHAARAVRNHVNYFYFEAPSF